MKSDRPLISVITVVYNSVDTLEQTIKSVLAQTYKSIQYIVIDGGSTDGSIDIIKKYADKLSYWISEKDSGIYDAMNKGLQQANGELISILNSDDWYEEGTVLKIVEAYHQYPDDDIFHGLLRFFNAKGEPDLICGHFSNFLDRGMIEHPTCFIKKNLYNNVGQFDLRYKSAADYDWTLRARKVNAKFHLIPFVLTNFRRGGMSDSYYGFSEELLIKKRNGLISSFKYSYWQLFSKFKAILKK